MYISRGVMQIDFHKNVCAVWVDRLGFFRADTDN